MFSKMFVLFESILVLGGVFLKEIVTFNIGFGFFVFNSILEHGLKIFFDPKIEKTTPQQIEKSQKCEPFSYETFGNIFWICGPLTSWCRGVPFISGMGFGDVHV